MTIRENLEYYSRIIIKYNDTKQIFDEVSRVIDLFELSEFQHDRVDSLREGIQKRANIAISFLGKPNVIILDEIIACLDWEWQKKFSI